MNLTLANLGVLALVSSALGGEVSPRYELILLPELPGAVLGRALHVDESGVIAGESSQGGEGDYPHAVVWIDEQVIELTGSGLSISSASGVSADGLVVGYSDELGGVGFEWRSGGTAQRLTPHPLSWAKDVNDAGIIVGAAISQTVNGLVPARWVNGTLELISEEYGTAFAINNAGDIIGTVFRSEEPNRPVMWRDGDVFEIGSLGNRHSEACGLSADGWVVGYSEVQLDLFYANRAFVWDGKMIAPLGSISANPEVNSIARSINSAHQIVGLEYGPSTQRGVLWENGSAIDLNDVTKRAAGWRVADAHHINENGWIAVGAEFVDDFRSHAAVLLPARCDGDANDDGAVNVNDVSFTVFRLGQRGGFGDIDHSGSVDVNDITYVVFRLGDGCP